MSFWDLISGLVDVGDVFERGNKKRFTGLTATRLNDNTFFHKLIFRINALFLNTGVLGYHSWELIMFEMSSRVSTWGLPCFWFCFSCKASFDSYLMRKNKRVSNSAYRNDMSGLR